MSISRCDDEDFRRELEAHVALETDRLVEEGLSPAVARDAAMRRFGNPTAVRERFYESRRAMWLDHLRQDVRYASRSCARNPGFTGVVVLTLALGIGANTTIFSVVNAVLLRSLPYEHSDHLVRIAEVVPAPEGATGAPRRVSPLGVSDLAAFRAQITTLSHVGVHIPTILTLTGRDEAVRLVGARVSPAVLAMLGVQPALGRLFESREEEPTADPVVVVSHTLWHRYFGGRPDVLGESFTLDGRTYTIVGVMPSGFQFPDHNAAYWIPFVLPSSGPSLRQRLPLTGRVKDGVALTTVVAEVTALLPQVRSDGPASTSGATVPDGRSFELIRLIDLIVGPVRPALIVMAGAVGFVLLIACVNVANLFLARAVSRQREIALRVALGAGRGRLACQVLTESVMLAVAGGVVGIAIAFGGIRVLRVLGGSLPRSDVGPSASLPRLDEIGIDVSVLAFALCLSVLTGIVFGLIPALRQSHGYPIAVLRQNSASSISGFNLFRRQRLQGLLIVAEIGMAVMLFVGGGLLMHSFVKLLHLEPGFDPTDVLTFNLSLPPARPYTDLATLAADLRERLESVPHVIHAGYVEALPMIPTGRFVSLRTTPDIPPRPPGSPAPRGTISPEQPDARFVSRGYLEAMGTRVVAGRGFGSNDSAGHPRVMLVNQTLVRSGVLGESPIGKQIYAFGHEPWEIVGIVEDVRQRGLTVQADPQVYVDFRQLATPAGPTGLGLYFAIRTDGASAVVASSIRAVARELDSQAMVENVAPIAQLLSHSIARPRLYAVLLTVFAGIAVALAAIGIYGVMAYAVVQRTREIGIRVALGAARGNVVALVLLQSLVLTAIGMLVGLSGAAAISGSLERLLFGVTPLDPTTFGTVAIAFALIATLAAVVPARRATKVDPIVALRCE